MNETGKLISKREPGPNGAGEPPKPRTYPKPKFWTNTSRAKAERRKKKGKTFKVRRTPNGGFAQV